LRPDWEAAALLEAQIWPEVKRRGHRLAASALSNATPMRARYSCIWRARWSAKNAMRSQASQFEQLLQAYPNNPDVVYPVAILALQENDTALAEAQLKHLITLDIPNKSAPYYYLGQLAEEGKRSDEALDLLSAGRYRRALSAGTDSQRQSPEQGGPALRQPAGNCTKPPN
jgi:tetratricopeptide (TPR) repeat protein